MKTAFPRKYILNIVPEDEDVSSGYSIISDGIHLDNLLEDLNNVNIALPEGELQRLKNIGNFAVFVFMFDGMTLCLSASNNDFARVRFPVSEFSLPQEGIDRNVAWSFLCSNLNWIILILWIQTEKFWLICLSILYQKMKICE